MRHELKTWRDPFCDVADGRKRHEIRKETDRIFREGDLLFLREWNEETRKYTGRAVEARVLHITRGPEWDIPEGMVVMSIELAGELIEGTYPADQDDPEVTRDLLMLASVDVPIEAVASWSPEERKAADDWASASVLYASDNDDVVVPPIPDHVERDRLR